jgi:hypothetical protein
MDDWIDPGFGAAFRPLVKGCHEAGAKIALLTHAELFSPPVQEISENRNMIFDFVVVDEAQDSASLTCDSLPPWPAVDPASEFLDDIRA